MHDLIIIGAGPAGVTAAIYAARKNMNVILITRDVGGQAAWAAGIENYPGYQLISGADLSIKFEEHLRRFNLEMDEFDEVLSVKKKDNYFEVFTDEKSYKCRCIIITSGRNPRLLGVPGEIDFKNKGISYCSTCDAPLFKGKTVAVVGGGNAALDAVYQLISIAAKIYVINVAEQFTADDLLVKRVTSSDKVFVYNNSSVKMILGHDFVEGIMVSVNNKDEQVFPVNGIFVEIGSIPAVSFLGGLGLALNEKKEIIINNLCETNVEGVFAAGDVTNIPEKQIIVAAGHGCIASLTAYRYILENNNKFN
ncbi:MAG: thioredoxin-disulfide reductase [Candidatus Margulisiibacteriota bacterium]|nr:MAG: hypothetical protein A2X43_06160 [Candidatus Margulisbacteria bacterium GWD2_39_127]OGI01407.1 MAG: hypothetical protein A2X42_12985 [Candidatus Margulisbacteria bacterium GWF2_38_17]OGI10325.1 MAG: hypothetical protein A2X41_12970 [Candidatus Margulisbacteria bacterium GWE2_39_32]PZM84970.1 MAG: thioredoxin-disulfide reductase [Candidatus Margulisiibacteriota bacterium]HAR62010.1 thioredoxin-disulfide reductase [Candidatus Margulisiibacteriota bacterium]